MMRAGDNSVDALTAVIAESLRKEHA
jgi:hypothetical protein